MRVDRCQPLRKQHVSYDLGSFAFAAGANPECVGFGGCRLFAGTRRGNRRGADRKDEANRCRCTTSPPQERAAERQDGTVPSNHITSIIGTPYPKPKGARPPFYVLAAGFQGLLDDECAACVVAGLLIGLLDDLNLHYGCPVYVKC